MAQRPNFKSFARPDVLKKMAVADLVELLTPYRGYFEARGCPLPPKPGEEPDYRKLSLVLLSSDEETPTELIEALFVISDLGIEERFDDLMEVAILNGIEAGPDVTPIDLCLRLWLKVPKALQRLVRDELFQRKLKFEHFPAQVDATAIPIRDLPFDLSALEAELDSWYQEHGRGPGCTISRADSETEARFLIEHGRPCKRERNRKGRESSLLFYRPEKIDVVVYDEAANEFRVHSDGIREMRLYLKAFGKHLFGREDQFTYREKYTLEPLKQRGRDALNCRSIESLEAIRLREIQYAWDGAFKEVEVHRASDVFLAFALRNVVIPQEAFIRKAIFDVKLVGIEKPEKVTITLPNTATLGHGPATALIEQWLREQGFILLGVRAEDEEAEPVVAGV
jgi:hypothetical protein